GPYGGLHGELAPQLTTERFEKVRLIVDEQDPGAIGGGRHAGSSSWSRSAQQGCYLGLSDDIRHVSPLPSYARDRVKTDPALRVETTRMSPPLARASGRGMNRPSPVPLVLMVIGSSTR